MNFPNRPCTFLENLFTDSSVKGGGINIKMISVKSFGKRLQFQGVSAMIGVPSNDAGGLPPETQGEMSMRNTRKRYNGIGVCCAILLVLTLVLDAVAARMDAQVGDGDIPPRRYQTVE